MDHRTHWEEVYRTRKPAEVSWFQASPEPSLSVIRTLGLRPEDPIIDIGAGASALVDHLLDEGFTAVSCLDVSGAALDIARARLGPARSERVRWTVSDIARWTPEPGAYALWHDRAALHFLTSPPDRDAYRERLNTAVRPGGYAVIAAFAPDGPTRCSGLSILQQDPQRIAEITGPAFELLEHWTLPHLTPGGAEQLFAWFVLQRQD
ncbi:MAG TPA: SAM-dependent methyltransferase [Phycisphaerales bacterium]|nr:SAM-dependent methyltransferase [Phycisphaerales bacterium]